MSATSIVAAVAIVFGVVAARRDNGPEIVVGGTGTTTVTTPTTVGPTVDDRFVPPTTVQHGLVVLPVTLPDGETFTLRYPPAMKIAQLGFAGGGGVVGFSGVSSRQVTVGYTNVQRVYGAAPPRSIFHDATGNQVSLYEGPDESGKLAFQFGPWLVQVADDNYAMTDSQLATWARNLTGTVDANGYLVLHAKTPLRVANWFDGGFGSFDSGNLLELANHLYCGQPESDTSAHRRFTNGNRTHGVSWCDGDLHVVASGAPSFVDLADRQLEVSTPASSVDLRPTLPSTTTTTTTLPAGAPSKPMSASFVSPEHGFVLEQDGSIAETRDAGSTWNTIGHTALAQVADSTVHIRFADAAHGFLFTPYPSAGWPFLETVDGGVHWSTLAAPFSAVSDLDISGGVVYVVGEPKTTSKSFPGFRIWSTPVSNILWTMDPLNIPVGAGPVPSQQLTFAGGRGWMVNNDRATISGARLTSPNGRWTAWTPPCAGSTDLAATTATDVVALCSPAFATDATSSTLAFSHDGGATFGPKVTLPPGAGGGGPLSPNPDTAVIEATDTLRRTTDDGATWQVVARTPNAYVTDGGFTTATQGFVVMANGPMLMTYDAGATWQRGEASMSRNSEKERPCEGSPLHS